MSKKCSIHQSHMGCFANPLVFFWCDLRLRRIQWRLKIAHWSHQYWFTQHLWWWSDSMQRSLLRQTCSRGICDHHGLVNWGRSDEEHLRIDISTAKGETFAFAHLHVIIDVGRYAPASLTVHVEEDTRFEAVEEVFVENLPIRCAKYCKV